MATTVAFSDLDTWLQNQPANTVDTPYELNITGITSADLSVSGTTCPFRNVIYNNLTKYIDLRETVLPNVTNLNYTFIGCTNLVYAPSIPETVNYMGSTFFGCTSLKTPPSIPSSIYDMGSTFAGCTAITETPVFEETLEQSSNTRYLPLKETFSGCTSISSYGSPLPKRITNFYQTFKGCTSLTETPLFTGLPSQYPMQANTTFMNCTALTTIKEFPLDATMPGTFVGCTGLTDLSNVIIAQSSVSSLFKDCTNLTKPPKFTGAVTDFSYNFQGCTSLTEIPELPTTVTKVKYLFDGCTSLVEWKIKEWNLTITGFNGEHCFRNCSNLVNFYTDTPYELKSWISTAHTDLPTSISNCNFYEYSETAENTITVLNNELSAWSENTTLTPLKIKVTGLTSSNLGDLNTALSSNPTKFVDISDTVLPNNILSMSGTFMDCVSLIKAPDIPENVTSLIGTFANCSNLAEAPAIPDGVTSLQGTFSGCTSITTIEKIPSSVTDLTSTFYNCSSLVEIEEFDIPISVLKTNAPSCFSGCTSLTTVGVEGVDPITEASEWHVIRLNFGADNVSGKVYDKDKNTTTIPQTTVQKGTLKLPIKTDELWFPPSNMSDADVDEVIESVIDTKRTYFNKDVLNPLNKSFVLWKDSQSQFVSNIDFGGGGGSGITVYDTEEELEEDLPNLSDGDIVGTYGDGEPTFNDAPLGSTMSYLGNTDPSDGKWLICDGRDTTGTAIELETHYPNLYMFLGGTNVLPEIFDHSRPSAIETFDLTRTNQAVPYDGHIIDTCATNAGSGLYVNDVLVGYNMYYNGNRNTCVIPVRKGDLVRRQEVTVGIYSAQWYKSHKIIKATSYVDYYHAPASEIAQIEQYFDNGIDTVKNNALSYSTEEVWTGGYWLDGKPIYRRVYDGLNFGSTANNWVNTGATTTGVDRLINATVMRYDSVNDMNAVISLINIRVQISTGNIQYYTTTTAPMCDKIIVEYTKTTD